jgi:hypothetical protein
VATGNYCMYICMYVCTYVLATDAPGAHQIHQRPKLLAWERPRDQDITGDPGAAAFVGAISPRGTDGQGKTTAVEYIHTVQYMHMYMHTS